MSELNGTNHAYTTIYIDGSWKHIIKDGFLDATSNVSETDKLFVELFYDTPTTFSVDIGEFPIFYNLQSDGTWVDYMASGFEQHYFTIVATDHIEDGVRGVRTVEGFYFLKSAVNNRSGGYWTGPFPPTNASNFTPSAVCFLEGTAITTDQGPIPIEQLTKNNTIFASKVNNITESINYFGHLIHFKPNALAQDLPSTDTFATPTHAIFCPKDKCMKMAKDFCDGENVLEDYTKDKSFKIYNVVCEDDNGDIIAHSMYVNNLLCECLHPHAYPLVKNQLKW